MKNYYRILQLDPSAEPAAIAAAYRRLALKYHPDKNKSDGATARMQEINEAYQILRNPRTRSEYDRWLQARPAERQKEPPPPPRRPRPKPAAPASSGPSARKPSASILVHATNVRAYKRYSLPEKTEPMTKKLKVKGQWLLAIGEPAGRCSVVQCPWCKESYAISVAGKNVFFNCVKCNQAVLVTRD